MALSMRKQLSLDYPLGRSLIATHLPIHCLGSRARQPWSQSSFRFVYLLIKLSPLYNIPQTQWYTTPVVGFVRALNVGQEGITT